MSIFTPSIVSGDPKGINSSLGSINSPSGWMFPMKSAAFGSLPRRKSRSEPAFLKPAR